MKQILLIIALITAFLSAADAQPISKSPLPTNIKVANDQIGANLGAKINAADAACGGGVGCQIWVFDGGSAAANTISSQVIVGSNHTLRFFEGIFYCKFPTQSAVILLKDNSNLIGAGWNTVIVENNDPLLQTYNPATGQGAGTRTANYRIVASFNTQFSCSSESANNTCRSTNLHVSDIQFKGIRTNQHDGGVVGAVGLGHCWGCSVRRNWFNEVSGYAAHFGSTQAGADGETFKEFTHAGQTMYAANYSKDNYFTDNLMTNIQSQMFAVISSENVWIERNIFREPGKRPYTITSVTNSAGDPIVVTVSEAHHIPGGDRVRLRGVMATGGAPAFNQDQDYRIKPLTPTSFSLVKADTNTGTVQNPIYITPQNGTGTGRYTVTSDSKVDYRGIFIVGLDVEPNGSFYERVNNMHIVNNLFDFRQINGVAATAVAHQITAAGIANSGNVISGNTILGNETGTGTLSGGLTVATSYTTKTTVSDNYINCGGGNNIGLLLSGSFLTVNNNTIENCGGGGSGSLQTGTLTHSSVTNNVLRNVTWGQAIIRERGVSNNNRWTNNHARLHYHDTDSVITSSIYLNNYWAGAGSDMGFFETTLSNNNIYQGNITAPRLIGSGNYGLTIVGTQSKVLSHSFTDGRTFITNINGTSVPFLNPN